MTTFKIKNIAFYAFFCPSFDLEEARVKLRQRMLELGIKGSILLAPEGINCSLSAARDKMDEFQDFIFMTMGINKPDVKVSYSQEIPFKRVVVKIKEHIVAEPGSTPINLNVDSAPYISPEEFHQWMTETRKMVVLDARNDFEFKVGRFKNSVHLGTKHFADFENDLNDAPGEWQNIPIVTFCTGGIRCEKAAPLMIKKGFQKVYQLDGGILNYFKKIGKGYFEGECFVFDERMALNEELKEKIPN